jgi:hypothetical protein
MPLLEHWDRHRATARVGDGRVVIPAPAAASIDAPPAEP